MSDLPIVAAGREIPHAADNIRRYCGRLWSGGPPETWAWPYYDEVPTEHDDIVTPGDVLCAAAVHPGLSRADLAFFMDRSADLTAWLALVPGDARFHQLSDDQVDHLAGLARSFPEFSIALLSKVLHRKRPQVIPLLDRHVVDWYRPVTGKRVMAEAWDPVFRAMRDDVYMTQAGLMNIISISEVAKMLWPEDSDRDDDERPRLPYIRALDIAIWMVTR